MTLGGPPPAQGLWDRKRCGPASGSPLSEPFWIGQHQATRQDLSCACEPGSGFGERQCADHGTHLVDTRAFSSSNQFCTAMMFCCVAAAKRVMTSR